MKVRLLAILLCIAGCAVAAEDVDGVAPGRKVRGDAAQQDDDTGATDEDTGSPPDSAVGTDSESLADTVSSGGDTGSSGSDTGSSGSDSGSGGTTCSMLTSTDCTSATNLGSMSGDGGSGVKTATGTDSKFLRVTLSEDDSSLFSSKDLRARITLTSTGGNFDLFVYMGATKGDGGGLECSTVKSSSTSATGSDAVSLSWNDNRPVGGHDDTRVLTVEVRATMAKCDGASWDLRVEGNK